MKVIAKLCIALGLISLIIGIISRITVTPVGPGGIEANAFLAFTNTCLLLAIALILLEIKK